MNLKKLIAEALTDKKLVDCGCGCAKVKCFESPTLNENLKSRTLMTEHLQYHIDGKLPLSENTFRYGSKAFLDLWKEARSLYSRNILNVSGIDKEIITETKLGEYGMFEGKRVPLDLPMLEEEELEEISLNSAGAEELISKVKNNPSLLDKLDFNSFNDFINFLTSATLDDWYQIRKEAGLALNEAEYQGKKVQIGKPKRGGASGKKFYVYVMDKGKVKKISFGDSGGLSSKVNNPKARQAFSKRHNCPQKTDRTKASYWSCRIGRYWKSLGGSKNFSGYW